MEALVQNCLRRAMQGSRSAAFHFAAQRTAAKFPPHAVVLADSLQSEDYVRFVSTSSASGQSLPPANQLAISRADHITLSTGKSIGSLVNDLLISDGRQTMSQATASGGRGGSYQSWLAAGAFPFAVAAYSSVALAKEKAPLALPAEVVLYQYEACPFCNKVKGERRTVDALFEEQQKFQAERKTFQDLQSMGFLTGFCRRGCKERPLLFQSASVNSEFES